jgi:hypothetical protein
VILFNIVDTTGRHQLVIVSAKHDRVRLEFYPELPFADGGFGGQVLHVSGDVVFAHKTQDAGKTTAYYFTGPN